jgi:hypothetical protein
MLQALLAFNALGLVPFLDLLPAPDSEMLFTHEEMGRILGAVDVYSHETSTSGRENARRLRASF